jgi:hypothetical protein
MFLVGMAFLSNQKLRSRRCRFHPEFPEDISLGYTAGITIGDGLYKRSEFGGALFCGHDAAPSKGYAYWQRLPIGV